MSKTELGSQECKELFVIFNPSAIIYFTINEYEKSPINVPLESSLSVLSH